MSNYRGARFNGEGYFSPTEYEAIRRVQRDLKRKAKNHKRHKGYIKRNNSRIKETVNI